MPHAIQLIARQRRELSPALALLKSARHLAWLLGLLFALPASSPASSTIFGGGPFYTGGYTVMNNLRTSGYTTVMLWCIHVDQATGNLIYNDQLVVANGVYVGTADWTNQLKTLKVAPTSVNRIEWSLASWGVDDFGRLKALMDTYGTNTDSIVYRNFLALKNATGADAIDYDDETQYDVATGVKLGLMLSSIGYKVTLCPFTNPSYWQSVYNQLGTNIVDRVYLQCYDGGANNNPVTWNNYFSGTKVIPGMWCLHSSCSAGNTASQVATQMTNWRSSAGIPGGFMWLYDDMLSCTSGGTYADYAQAINRAVEPLNITPSTGFAGVAAYQWQAFPASTKFVLANGTANPLAWSVINTSAWLTVSATLGTNAAGVSTNVTVSLNTTAATNLAAGLYTANVIISNRTSGVAQFRSFSLNTAVANWPIALTGFNAAVLASNTATASVPTATAFDLQSAYCFYQAGLSGSTRGLPLDGVFFSLSDSSTAFKLGPFGAPDALMLGNTYPKYGTLTLTSPAAYNSLTVLATSANGGGQGTFVLNFTDGSKSPVFAFNCQDWFYVVTNVALQGFGRLKLGTTLSAEDNGSANPNLYQTTINLAALGLTRPIASLTFSNRAGAGAAETTGIFALSGMPNSLPLAPPTGLTAIPGTNATVKLAWNAVAGATNYNVKSSLVSGSGYTTIASGRATNYTATGLANGTPYYFVVTAVGTRFESTNSAQVSAMPGSYQGWAFGLNPAGYWPLNELSGTVAYELVQGNNGTYGSGATFWPTGPVGVGFGSPHRAISYNGSSTAYTQIPRLIGATNFTILFWVRTTASGGTANWYNGQGLVDGEVSGTANDFGVALVGSKVGFGVGNPDTTLTSVAAINNGLWHQVAVTRNAGSGLMTICIDGKFDNRLTGPIGARTTPPALRIGGIQSGSGYFTGYLSDVTCYNQELTTNQIALLYSAATGLYYNVTLTNQLSGANLRLTWPGNGKLLEATNLAGPWTTNVSTSPATITPGAPQKFYRIRTQ